MPTVEQRKKALASGELPPPRVFPKVDADNFRSREWRRILEKAKLRYVPIKALRHTFASLNIAQDESLAYVRDTSSAITASKSPWTTMGTSCPAATVPPLIGSMRRCGATIRNPAHPAVG